MRIGFMSMVAVGMLLLALLLVGRPAARQAAPIAVDTTLIPDQPACPDCEINLEPILTIVDGEGHLGSHGHGLRRPNGDLILVTLPSTTELQVYSSAGAFVRRLGRDGDGPGEYRNIARLRAEGERIHVVDNRSQRITILGADLAFVRDYRLPLRVFDLLVLPDSTTIVNGIVPTRERAGHHFHRLTRDGEFLLSFGDLSGQRITELTGLRVLAAADQASFWSLSREQYVLEKWTSSGRLLGAWRRPVSWLENRAEPVGRDEPPMPQPMMGLLQTAGKDRVWTIARVADRRWRDAAVMVTEEGMTRPGWSIPDQDLFMDSIIELLDLSTGRVIARKRVDEYFHQFADENHLLTFSESAAGVPVLRMWKLGLKRQQP